MNADRLCILRWFLVVEKELIMEFSNKMWSIQASLLTFSAAESVKCSFYQESISKVFSRRHWAVGQLLSERHNRILNIQTKTNEKRNENNRVHNKTSRQRNTWKTMWRKIPERVISLHIYIYIVTNSRPPGVRSAALLEWRPSRPPDGQFSRGPSGTIARNRPRTGI